MGMAEVLDATLECRFQTDIVQHARAKPVSQPLDLLQGLGHALPQRFRLCGGLFERACLP